MSWNDPELLKEVAAIEAEILAATTPNSEYDAGYESAMEEIRGMALSARSHTATSARVLLAVMPIMREYHKTLNEKKDTQRATDLLIGLSDGVGNVIANLLRCTPVSAHSIVTDRIGAALNANLKAFGDPQDGG